MLASYRTKAILLLRRCVLDVTEINNDHVIGVVIFKCCCFWCAIVLGYCWLVCDKYENSIYFLLFSVVVVQYTKFYYRE